jgi:hypothetical protein
MFGKHHSAEAKEKNKTSHLGKSIGENNPMHGKSPYDIWVEKYGKEIADKKWKLKYEKHSNRMIGRGTGKDNPMYKNSLFKIWLKKYGKKIANKKLNEWKLKLSKPKLFKQGE